MKRKLVAIQFSLESELRLGGKSRFHRVSEERLRRDGLFRRIVLAQLAKGHDPTREDLAAALRETPPDPEQSYSIPLTPEEQAALMHDPSIHDNMNAWVQDHIRTPDRKRAAIEKRRAEIATETALLCEYVAKTYIEKNAPRKRGPKSSRLTAKQEMGAVADYHRALKKAHEERAADDDRRRAVVRRAQARIAAKYGIGIRTLQAIISGTRARFE